MAIDPSSTAAHLTYACHCHMSMRKKEKVPAACICVHWPRLQQQRRNSCYIDLQGAANFRPLSMCFFPKQGPADNDRAEAHRNMTEEDVREVNKLLAICFLCSCCISLQPKNKVDICYSWVHFLFSIVAPGRVDAVIIDSNLPACNQYIPQTTRQHT